MPRTRITLALILLLCLNSAYAERALQLKNGWEISGKTARVPSIGAEILAAGAGDKGKRVWFVDDGLRRTFLPSNQVVGAREENPPEELIELPKQIPAIEGNRIGSIGSLVSVGSFDPYGRRTVKIQTPGRRIDIVQGITEVTAVWTKVQGLRSAKPYVWDMRVATSSIQRDALRGILTNHLDFNDADTRLNLVRLYIESEQYGPAEEELNQAIQAFPDLKKMKDLLRELRQLKAKQQLSEIELRQSNGQHRFVKLLLAKFPTEGVAAEVLLQAGEMKDKYKEDEELEAKILKTLRAQIDKIGNEPEKNLYEAFFTELEAELDYNSLPRLGTYVQLLDAENLPEDQKRALALSGWILGEQNATENLAVAVSCWKVREIVKKYLVSTDPQQRKKLIEELASQDAGAPAYVAQILANMKPPQRTKGLFDRLPAPPQEELNTSLNFELEMDGLKKETKVKYHIQLPPEYDANRRYPAIVVLHGSGGKPQAELEWWAGPYNKDLGIRVGQASRQGYIVIAPDWTEPKQRKYKYSARENAAVLSSLQDALQRFSIDTNRVFLSGHMMGGDAAWDIALAHPDLWAGVIPISATSEYKGKNSPNYIARYRNNAKQVSFYFLGGALDRGKIDVNKDIHNHYLQNVGYDTAVVEYLGRGAEDFYEDIPRMFDWMSVHERNPFDGDIEATIMRPWDNFFYWFEVSGLPDNAVVLPGAWPPAKGKRPMTVSGSIRDGKNVVLKTGTKRAKIFLSPEMVNLDEDVKIYVNGNVKRLEAKPSAATLLEDARRRGDRLHPFWVELELATGRGR